MFCLSLTVHEEPEVIRNQLDNINKYLPDTWIVLHLSLLGRAIKPALRQILRPYQNVLLNPMSYPTQWGWMYHAHLFNYNYARRAGLDFEYFILDSSNSLYFRRGAGEYIRQHDFLTRAIPLDLELQDLSQVWNWKNEVQVDQGFWGMVRDLQIKRFYRDFHEGTAFKRDLFDEMMQIFQRYYRFNLNEPRYPREELYPSTLAMHLGGMRNLKQSHPTIYLSWSNQIEIVKQNLAASPVENSPAGSGHANYYGIKPVPRKMGDPIRKFITELP